MSVPDRLAQHAKDRDWTALGEFASTVLQSHPNSSQTLFYMGLAKLRLNRPGDAIDDLRKGLIVAPHSRWGNFLLVEAYHSVGQPAAAIDLLRAHLHRSPDDEEAKELIVKALARARQFDQAQSWNRRRKGMEDYTARSRYAVVVQTFVKSDTLDEFFESLSRCSQSRQTDLFIIQDSIVGSRRFADFAGEHENVAALIGRWMPSLMERFARVECCLNARNLGTTATCQKALDLVALTHEGFLFFEDDCVLAGNALEWMMFGLDKLVGKEGPLFIAGESSFFDSHGQAVDEALLPRIKSIAALPDIRNAYTLQDFVPSTCFATTSGIWRALGGVRGLPLGDEDLNEFLKLEGRRRVCIAPVVPRVKDIGMVHRHGYSVAQLGREGVSEIKSTILLSDARAIEEEIVEIQVPSPLAAVIALR
jgi:tetratricopeptide (TPR) repeat protein